MNPVVNQSILSVVRSFLAFAGGILVTRGVLSAEMLNMIVGAVVTTVPLVWGIHQKWKAEKEARQREADAVNVGIVKADQTIGATPLVTPENTQALIKETLPVVKLKEGLSP